MREEIEKLEDVRDLISFLSYMFDWMDGKIERWKTYLFIGLHTRC